MSGRGRQDKGPGQSVVRWGEKSVDAGKCPSKYQFYVHLVHSPYTNDLYIHHSHSKGSKLFITGGSGPLGKPLKTSEVIDLSKKLADFPMNITNIWDPLETEDGWPLL